MQSKKLAQSLLAVAIGAIVTGLVVGAGLTGWNSGWSSFPLAIGVIVLAIWGVNNAAAIKQMLGLRSTQASANIFVATLAVGLILAVVNFLGARYTWQTDLTEAGFYSLSSQTETLVTELETDIELTWVTTQVDTNLQRQLERVQGLNPERLSLEIINPQRDPLRTQNLGVTADNTLVVSTAEGRRESLVNLNPLTFESSLTPAIAKITATGERTIYFLQGHGELSLEPSESQPSASQAIAALTNQGYFAEPLNLVTTEAVPADAAAVVVAAPRTPLFEAEVERLQAYLDQDGRLLALVPPLTETGLEPIISDWGVEFSEDVVVDVSQVAQVVGAGPVVVLVTTYGDHPITRPLQAQNLMSFFPLARSLQGPAENATPLLLSSSESWGETDTETERFEFDPETDRQGPLTLGYALSRSANPEAPEASEAPAEDRPEARLVVIGNAAFASDGNFSQLGNGDLFLNSVNWLADRSSLIAIQPKNATDRRFALTAQNINGLAVLATFILPLVALGGGGYIWWQRR